MTQLFSLAWMRKFGEQWNADVELVDTLSKLNFTCTIGYGFERDIEPTGVLIVEEGTVVSAVAYAGQVLDWDLRATPSHWQQWIQKGVNFSGLTMAYMTRKLQFRVGDISELVQDPLMVEAFIKAFSVMGRVQMLEESGRSPG